MINSKKKNSAKFFIFRGLPGVGKTTLALELKKRLADKCEVLDPDQLDRSSVDYLKFCESIPPGTSEMFFPYRYLLNSATSALAQNKTVVWSQAWTQLSGIEKAIASLRKNVQSFEAVVVELKLSKEETEARLKKREMEGGNILERRPLGDFERVFEKIENNLPSDVRYVELDAAKEPTFLADTLFETLCI